MTPHPAGREEGRRVLVCGGREYGCIPRGCPADQWEAYRRRAERERFLLTETLDVMHGEEPIAVIIHGAQAGADNLAGYWADSRGVKPEPYKAEWKKYGRGAGPRRNAEMIAVGKPDLVVAFPGGDGTANMAAQARKAGIPVIEIAAAPEASKP